MSNKRKWKEHCSYVYFSKNILLFLVLSLWCCCSSAMAATGQNVVVFGDIHDHWAQSDISRLSALELVKGYPDHTFKPDQLVNRLETVVLIVRSGGLTSEAEQPATKYNKKNDQSSIGRVKAQQTPKVPWGQSYIDLAVKKGFLALDDPDGYDDEGAATRLEVAELLARAMYLVPPATENESAPVEEKASARITSAKTFSDLGKLKPAEQIFITAVANAEVMSGYPDGTFRPQESLSRAEMAVILSRLVDRGWIKIPSGRRLAGWISGIENNKNRREIALTSLFGVQKLQVAENVQCYRAGEKRALEEAVNFRCELILDGHKRVNWVNSLEQKDNALKTENIRGSVKMVMLGKDNLIVVCDMHVNDLILPLAWQAVLTGGKKAAKDFASLKQGDFVDVEVAKGQVVKVTLLEVKTTSGKVDRIEGGRLYLKGDPSGNKPVWFNHYDFARIVNKDGDREGEVKTNSQVTITYLDPLPGEIDDEAAIEIKVTK
ncbi:S-layer homology domain-containing protein [Pelotomaculum sp. PtaB.Bin117]|uniref:S-layer homology domain-containing protein n=1 Tax=Pelotomaculum sp. PtaB.Bin117 TaxID=1811694 RepID=UPI0009C8BFAA|nr:S-layer homology domain-containing protein [Pelotomaculum sp. PtaB.Bin117]OPX91272.1 MAG: Cellulosome-anchoring protein precursor [Pelotomaculum sp. PtaB.Bin117]